MSAAGLHDVRRNSEPLMIETSDTALFRPISSDLRMPRTSEQTVLSCRLVQAHEGPRRNVTFRWNRINQPTRIPHGEALAYVIERADRHGKARFMGMYRTANGKIKSAGTFNTYERAIGIAQREEAHVRGPLNETSPADKATKTIKQFGDDRFLRDHHSGAATRQNYGHTLRNHIYPYIGHQRISEVSRETFYNLLIKILSHKDGECASPATVRATRRVLPRCARWRWTRATAPTTRSAPSAFPITPNETTS